MKLQIQHIEAVLFDMDGVIFDTERLAAQGWKYAGKCLGFEITDDQISLNRGRDIRSGSELFAGWFGRDFPFLEARKLRTDYVNSYIKENGMPVKPGIRGFFAKLKAQGIKKAIATSTDRDTVKWYFREAGIPFDFEAAVCGGEVRNSKPAPDIFLEAARRLGVKPQHCLVIEDSPSGVRAGAAAGCKVVMVPDMTEPDDEMRELCYGIARSVLEVEVC